MLTSREVLDDADLEEMRLIYLQCLEGMGTAGKVPPTKEQQRDWWHSLPHPHRAWLYFDGYHDIPCAFMMLQWKGEFATPMFGIVQWARGRGYARTIIQDYINKAEGPLAGTAPLSNTVINRLNEEMGWQRVGARDGVVLLYHSGTDTRQQECYDEIMRYHGID